MARTPVKQYQVRLKSPMGRIEHEAVVASNSPRGAIGAFCDQNNRSLVSVVKYGSWAELQNAFYTQGGVCTPCEVVQLYGERKNYYILYTI